MLNPSSIKVSNFLCIFFPLDYLEIPVVILYIPSVMQLLTTLFEELQFSTYYFIRLEIMSSNFLVNICSTKAVF